MTTPENPNPDNGDQLPDLNFDITTSEASSDIETRSIPRATGHTQKLLREMNEYVRVVEYGAPQSTEHAEGDYSKVEVSYVASDAAGGRTIEEIVQSGGATSEEMTVADAVMASLAQALGDVLATGGVFDGKRFDLNQIHHAPGQGAVSTNVNVTLNGHAMPKPEVRKTGAEVPLVRVLAELTSRALKAQANNPNRQLTAVQELQKVFDRIRVGEVGPASVPMQKIGELADKAFKDKDPAFFAALSGNGEVSRPPSLAFVSRLERDTLGTEAYAASAQFETPEEEAYYVSTGEILGMEQTIEPRLVPEIERDTQAREKYRESLRKERNEGREPGGRDNDGPDEPDGGTPPPGPDPGPQPTPGPAPNAAPVPELEPEDARDRGKDAGKEDTAAREMSPEASPPEHDPQDAARQREATAAAAAKEARDLAESANPNTRSVGNQPASSQTPAKEVEQTSSSSQDRNKPSRQELEREGVGQELDPASSPDTPTSEIQEMTEAAKELAEGIKRGAELAAAAQSQDRVPEVDPRLVEIVRILEAASQKEPESTAPKKKRSMLDKLRDRGREQANITPEGRRDSHGYDPKQLEAQRLRDIVALERVGYSPGEAQRLALGLKRTPELRVEFGRLLQDQINTAQNQQGNSRTQEAQGQAREVASDSPKVERTPESGDSTSPARQIPTPYELVQAGRETPEQYRARVEGVASAVQERHPELSRKAALERAEELIREQQQSIPQRERPDAPGPSLERGRGRAD